MRVIAAVIVRAGSVLIAQRPLHARHGGYWEFPGGKLEPGESAAAAAARELREELSLEVRKVHDALWSTTDPGSAFVIEFARVEARGEPIAHEHTALAWVTPERLAEYALAPSDAQFVRWWLSHSSDE